MYQKNERERENYFLEQEEALLKGGTAFSEWCTFISKSVYDAFVRDCSHKERCDIMKAWN